MITSIWACIAYITSYICKPEKTMSELMQKASKEANDKGVTDKLYHIANQLRKGREVSHHEAIMRCLSMPFRRSNIPVAFVATDFKENRTKIIKQRSVLDTMEDDDTDIYIRPPFTIDMLLDHLALNKYPLPILFQTTD